MNFSFIRSFSSSDINARHALETWRDSDLVCYYSHLPRDGMLVSITAYGDQGQWSGYIDLYQWLSHISPELAGMAMNANNGAERILSLFNTFPQPLESPLSELNYHSFEANLCSLDIDAKSRSYVSIETNVGNIWISKFPPLPNPKNTSITRQIRKIPIPVSLVLGTSEISYRYLRKISPGDVLLISRRLNHVSSEGNIIGIFSFFEEGKLLMESIEKSDVNDEYVSREMSSCIKDIRISMEFILNRQKMTLEELEKMYLGQLLILDQDAEKNIEITVNGMRIAQGELVEINGQLGVEVVDIEDRSKNAK